MRTLALTMFGLATTLSGCAGTSVPVDASALCRSIGIDLLGARGLTPVDQTKIDVTEERLVRIDCVTRDQVKMAAGAK